MCCIFAYRLFFGGRLYKKWPLDVLETFFCLNTLLFATFTWYSLNNPNSNKKAAVYTSVTITIVVLLLIILYHIYTFMLTSLVSKIKKTKLRYPDGTVNTDEHDTIPLLQPPPVEPTFSYSGAI